MKRFLCSTVFLFMISSVQSSVLIVDQYAPHYPTIQAAANAAVSGDIIIVQNLGGNFTTNYITSKENLEINGSGTSVYVGTGPFIEIQTSRKIIIRNFFFTTASNQTAISISTSSTNTNKDIRIFDCNFNAVPSTSGNIGISNYGNNTIIDNCNFYAQTYGIWGGSPGYGGSNLTVNRCTFSGTYGVRISYLGTAIIRSSRFQCGDRDVYAGNTGRLFLIQDTLYRTSSSVITIQNSSGATVNTQGVIYPNGANNQGTVTPVP